jgi:hypothetical protein
MTAGPNEEHVMKAKREQQSPPEDIERFRKELSLKIQRLVAESLEAWPTCDNVRCRRAKRCASEDRECIAKWRETLPPLAPEEAEQRLRDFKRELGARIAGLPLPRSEPEKPERAKKQRGNKPSSTPITMAQPDSGDNAPAPVEEPQIAPEKQERINQAWNEYVASLPAEDAEATEDAGREARKPGPRITML